METPDTSNKSSEPTIQISRPVFTDELFNKTFPPKTPEILTKTEQIKRKFQQKCECSCDGVKRLVYYLVPVLYWVPRYNIRDNAVGDLAAGLTVGVVNIPQGKV